MSVADQGYSSGSTGRPGMATSIVTNVIGGLIVLAIGAGVGWGLDLYTLPRRFEALEKQVQRVESQIPKEATIPPDLSKRLSTLEQQLNALKKKVDAPPAEGVLSFTKGERDHLLAIDQTLNDLKSQSAQIEKSVRDETLANKQATDVLATRLTLVENASQIYKKKIDAIRALIDELAKQR